MKSDDALIPPGIVPSLVVSPISPVLGRMKGFLGEKDGIRCTIGEFGQLSLAVRTCPNDGSLSSRRKSTVD